MPRFDSYIMVDWSAASVPRTGADSVWIAVLDRDRLGRRRGVRLTNPATRTAAKTALTGLFKRRLAAGRRVLAGFDFPFGYPEGTARRLGLEGPAWQALWQTISLRIDDGPRNENNRFAVAAELNRRLSNGPFPFWGCPAKAEGVYLGQRRARTHGPGDLAERRLADRATAGAQPVWKLFTTGSVGSQILMGLPVLQALRLHPILRDRIRVWPFETGLTLPPMRGNGGEIILAEIYPSLWLSKAPPGVVKDAAQVQTVVTTLSALDMEGRIADVFAPAKPLTPAEEVAVVEEEAWILGV
ncbi:MAG: cobalamin biosynthesis protein CbiG [Alphaproteobacteria bacterium]